MLWPEKRRRKRKERGGRTGRKEGSGERPADESGKKNEGEEQKD